MDPQLQTLIDLQGYDARIAALEAEAARLPKQIESIGHAVRLVGAAAGSPRLLASVAPLPHGGPTLGFGFRDRSPALSSGQSISWRPDRSAELAT